MDKKSFAELIKEQRQKQNLTLKELSERSGFTVRAIQYWEKGTKNISLENADVLLEALGIKLCIQARR